jgi:flagellar protein FlgJ
MTEIHSIGAPQRGGLSPEAPVANVRGSAKTGHGREEDPEKLRQACADFESFFLQTLLKEMRATVPRSGLMGGSSTESLYTSLLDGQMAREIAAAGGIGLADLFQRSLQDGQDGKERER